MESVNLNTGGTQAEDGGVTVSSNMSAFYLQLPPTPKDETEEIPALTAEDRKTYDLLQTYNSYQIEGNSDAQASPEATETPAPTEAAAPSSSAKATAKATASAKPTATP